MSSLLMAFTVSYTVIVQARVVLCLTQQLLGFHSLTLTVSYNSAGLPFWMCTRLSVRLTLPYDYQSTFPNN